MLALSKHEWQAFLIAPLAAPVSYWLGHLVLELTRALAGTSGQRFPGAMELARSLAFITIFGAPVAFAAALAIGLPVYLALRAPSGSPPARALRAGRALLAVAIAGILGLAIAAVLGPQLRGDFFSVPMPAWAGTAMGLISGAVFVQLVNARGRARV